MRIQRIMICLLCLFAYSANAKEKVKSPTEEIQNVLNICPEQVESALQNSPLPDVALPEQQKQICGCLEKELNNTVKQQKYDNKQIFSLASEKFTSCLAPEIGKQFTYNCRHNQEWIANAPARGFNNTQFQQFCQCMGEEFIPAMMREPNMPDLKSNKLTESCVRRAKEL